jgi:NAD(P)-dependent dehydrogenase (short-subunit alcohol dehydrogenase family)
VRTVVLTGVSRGLGAALLDELLDGGGWRIVALGRRFTDRQRELAGDRLVGDRLRLIEADFAEPATLPDAGRLAAELTGCAEAVLVHNAAVVGPIGPVGTLDDGALATAVTVNLTAPMVLTNAFLAAVPATAGRIRLLYVSSGAAHRPIEGWAAYCATKSGGEAYFSVVAAEAARRDRRVVVASVNPGVMNTGMQASLRGAEFPDRERYVELHARGELPAPTVVARRIIAEHLTGE